MMALNSFPPGYTRIPTVSPGPEDYPDDTDALSRSSSPSSSSRRPAWTRSFHLAAAASLFTVCSLAIFSALSATRISLYSQSGHALPLPTHQYFGLETAAVPPCKLWGPGLSEARQNVEAVFYIDFESANDPPLHPDLEDVAVWLEGPARFAADVSYAQKGRYVVRYTALDAGDYRLRVDAFRRTQTGKPYAYWLPLGLDTYNVTVMRQDGSRLRGDGRQELALPKERCRGDEVGSRGRWVRCEDTPLPCTRYGWIWVPRDCIFHIYTPDELAKQDLWIALVGTSVWRGIFFAGVDHLFGPLAANLSAPTSKFWKCWGRLSAESAKMRISYLDFRQQCIADTGALHCSGGDYLANTEKMLGKMAQERGGRGPDLVLWESNDNSHSNYTMLSLYRQWFGPSWTGAFVSAFRTYSPEVPYTHQEAGNIAAYASRNPEAKVETLDISRLGGGLFDTMEFPLKQSATFHWHNKCDYEGMHSCSPVDDMIFQIAVNRAVERQRRLPPRAPTPPATEDVAEDIRFCLQCPPSLDFSMRPEEDVQCFAGLPL
ncbi:hypothetical protein BJY59DRAFT_689350 [Rhodotorula toruloides]